MATISLASSSSAKTTFTNRQWKAVPVVFEAVIDFSVLAAKKGSTVVATDVIEVLRIPVNTYIDHAGLEVLEVVTGGSADVTVDLGTGADVDQWVDGYDLDAATAGAFATPVAIATTEPRRYFAASDTIHLTLATATTVPTAGKVRIFALGVNFTQAESVGLAQIGD